MQEKLEKRFFLKLHLIVSSGRFTDGLTKCSIVDLQRSPMHMGCILLDSKVDIYIFKPESRTNQVFHTKVLEGKKPLECNICHQKLSRMVTLFQFMESKTKAISNVNFVMMISILYLKVHALEGLLNGRNHLSMKGKKGIFMNAHTEKVHEGKKEFFDLNERKV